MSKRKETLKFLTTSAILYYLVLNQMQRSQNLAQLSSNPRQPGLSCTSPTSGHPPPPLSCLGIGFHTNLTKKTSPCSHNIVFSEVLAHLANWITVRAGLKDRVRTCSQGSMAWSQTFMTKDIGQTGTDELQHLMKLHLNQRCLLLHNFK